MRIVGGTRRKADGGGSSSMAVGGGGRHRKMHKSPASENIVFRFPGQRSSTASGRYDLRNSKDPRFQTIEKFRKDSIESWRAIAAEERERKSETFHVPEGYRIPDVDHDPDLADIRKAMAEMEAMYPPRSPSPLRDPDAPDDEILPKHVAEELKEWEDNFDRDMRAQDLKCARAALAYYNKTHKTKYKLTETLGSNRALKIGVWYHCNFKAKLTPRSPCAADTSSKLFFAELHRFRGLEVKSCVILGENNSRVGCCEICPYKLAHPIEGFEVAR